MKSYKDILTESVDPIMAFEVIKPFTDEHTGTRYRSKMTWYFWGDKKTLNKFPDMKIKYRRGESSKYIALDQAKLNDWIDKGRIKKV